MEPAPASDPTLRRGDAAALGAAWQALRVQTLAQFDAVEQVLGPGLRIDRTETVNPPLWELGHVAWFEELWVARNTERLRGAAARADATRAAPLLPRADALYDSGRVAHARRWQLELPDARRTRELLHRIGERSLNLLRRCADDDDDSLYFFRLAVAHEAMHHEAGLMTAQQLGWPVSAAAPAIAPPRRELDVPAQALRVGEAEPGFAFDNELGAHTVDLAAFRIDSTPLTWRDVLRFVDAGGAVAHLVRDDAFEHGHKRSAFGRWLALDLDAPAVHLNAHEASAWCAWAGRRLPSEHEWLLAQQVHGSDFAWGQVWEWTSSPFVPWPGFVAHPYRDYSLPWFDGRPVLKGGSFATQPLMKHPRYRNFFDAKRNDVFAGFRSCAAV